MLFFGHRRSQLVYFCVFCPFDEFNCEHSEVILHSPDNGYVFFQSSISCLAFLLDLASYHLGDSFQYVILNSHGLQHMEL
jgi:hypothetical protein